MFIIKGYNRKANACSPQTFCLLTGYGLISEKMIDVK